MLTHLSKRIEQAVLCYWVLEELYVNPLRLLGQIRCNKTKLITSFRPLISETVENLMISSKVSRVYCKGDSIGGKSHEGSGKNYLGYVWGKMLE